MAEAVVDPGTPAQQDLHLQLSAADLSVEIELGADDPFRGWIVTDDERVFRVDTASESERFLSLSDDEEAIRRHDGPSLVFGHPGLDADRREIELLPRTAPNRFEAPP